MKSFLRANWKNLMPLVFFMLVIFLYFVAGVGGAWSNPNVDSAIKVVVLINLFWTLVLTIVLIQNLIRRSWRAALMNFIGVGFTVLLVVGAFVTLVLPYA